MAHLLHPLELLMGPLHATVRAMPELVLLIAAMAALALARGSRQR